MGLIYSWQFTRLNPLGVRTNPETNPTLVTIGALKAPQGLPASSAQTAGEGVVGVYYLWSPFKTNLSKEQSLLSAGSSGSSTYGAAGSLCWEVGVQAVRRGCLQPSAECQFFSISTLS